jgi:hypothetical protein
MVVAALPSEWPSEWALKIENNSGSECANVSASTHLPARALGNEAIARAARAMWIYSDVIGVDAVAGKCQAVCSPKLASQRLPF